MNMRELEALAEAVLSLENINTCPHGAAHCNYHEREGTGKRIWKDYLMEKIPVIVVAGPTASGKTALAVELAKRLDGEIISADSMQIYKYMDIGPQSLRRRNGPASPII